MLFDKRVNRGKLTYIVALIVLMLLTDCGGKQSIQTPVDYSARIQGTAIERTVEGIRATPAPADVSPALWDNLTTELARILYARRISKVTAGPPAGDRNRVLDLQLADNGAGGNQLEWTYINIGDYDYNCEVNISDVTPIGLYFGAIEGGANWVLARAADGDGNGEVSISDITSIGQNYFANLSAYKIVGADSADGPWNELGTVDFSANVGGNPPRFEWPLASFDYALYRVIPVDGAGAEGIESVDLVTSGDVQLSGTVVWDTGIPIEAATVGISVLNEITSVNVVTDAGGGFATPFTLQQIPSRILVRATYPDPLTGLVLTNFHLTEEQDGSAPVANIVITLPWPENKELTLDTGTASSDDDSVHITGLAPEIARVFAQAYDPAVEPEMFPGDYIDDMGYNLDSAGFVWVTAVDVAGQPVTEFDTPAQTRFEIPPSQWGDLDDLGDDPNSIGVPMYSFDEATGQWSDMGDGILVDKDGNPVLEDQLPAINDGTYVGRLYASFEAAHFSWWNCDVALLDIWRLDHVPGRLRNSSGFRDVMELAKAMAYSPRGQAALASLLEVGNKGVSDETDPFACFRNDEGKLDLQRAPCVNPTDTNKELGAEAFTMGKWVTFGDGDSGMSGAYLPSESTQLFTHESMHELANDDQDPSLQKAGKFMLANEILGQTANQIYFTEVCDGDVETWKKRSPDITNVVPQIINKISPVVSNLLQGTGDLISSGITERAKTLSTEPITDEQLDELLDPASWQSAMPFPEGGEESPPKGGSDVGDSGLELTISSAKSSYNLSEDIVVDVLLTNGGSEPIDVLAEQLFVGYPIGFTIEDQASEPAAWLDPIANWTLTPDTFARLEPGEDVAVHCKLRWMDAEDMHGYEIYQQGTYSIKASYSEYICPYDPVESETLYLDITSVVAPEIISVSPMGCYEGNSEQFQATMALPNVESWAWNFGGGATPNTSSDEMPMVTIGSQGEYSASVTATNSVGNDIFSFTLEVFSPLMPSWPMFGCNPQHTRLSPFTGPQTNHLKWEYEHWNWFNGEPAIGADGTIYFVDDIDCVLHAINPNGTGKWSFTAGGRAITTPAIGADGTIYFNGSSGGGIYAVNPDGSQKWLFETEEQVYSSPAIGTDGTIYTVGTDNNLFALNPDGSEKWEHITANAITSPAIGADGTIYFGCQDNNLYAIYPDGSDKWSFDAGNILIYFSPAVGPDGTTYLCCDDKLLAVNPDGTEKWTYSHPEHDYFSDPAIGPDGTIYMGASSSYLVAVNPDGSEKWFLELGGWSDCAPAIGADGTIYSGGDEDHSVFYAINPGGTVKWSYDYLGGETISPAIAADGTVYMSSGYNGVLFAFQDAP